MRIEHMDLFSLSGYTLFPTVSGKIEYFILKDLSSCEEEIVLANRYEVSISQTDGGLLLYGNHEQFVRYSDFIGKKDSTVFLSLKHLLDEYFNSSQKPDPVALPDSKIISFEKPLIMGILNVTPDSFYGKSRIRNSEILIEKAKRMVEEGADILDIGGESTRPGSEAIGVEEEIDRVIPAIRVLRTEIDVPISVDTYRAKVARLAIEAGASIVNDISALDGDPDMIKFIASENIPIILMHMKGRPKYMQKNPYYEDVVSEISEFFNRKIEYACCKGLPKHQMILDPGIGFGKRLIDNIDIISNIDAFKKYGLPLLLGASRKSFIGEVLNQTDPEDRLEGTLATTAIGVAKGVNVFRVHDVKQNYLVANMAFSFNH